MKVTSGQIFIVTGSLLLSLGFIVPSSNHPSLNLVDLLPILLFWCFSLATFRFHDEIFCRERILPCVMPVLLIGFVILLLTLNYILSFGISEFNLYAVLLGWAFFNAGLYYDSREVLKEAPKKR